MQHHKYSLTELEAMIPWERDVYVSLLINHIKEEKILYMALESGDEQQMQSATKDILKSVTYNKIDVETLPTFDVEYIFLQVRAKSVGEVAKFKIICQDDSKTYGDIEVDISKLRCK